MSGTETVSDDFDKLSEKFIERWHETELRVRLMILRFSNLYTHFYL
jgi:hypothetical protein